MDKSTNLPPNQEGKRFDQDDSNREWGRRGFEQGAGQGSGESNYEPREEHISNEGYDEDNPGNPVRTTGSTREDQESGSIQPGDGREGKH